MTRAARLAGTGAVLCGLAVVFAAPALYVPGLSLLVVAVVAPLWVTLAAVGVRLVLTVPDQMIQEGDRIRVGLVVRRRLLPLPGAVLVLDPVARTLPVPRRRGGGRGALSIVLNRRGRQVIGPARLIVADPLGIHSREVMSEAGAVLVLPRVHQMSARATGGLDGRSGRRASARRVATELDSLRPYRRGAPASRIHWPTVARTNELVEHRMAGEADHRPLILLDPRGANSAESLDRALRATASLCVHLARRGGCGLLLPGDREPIALRPDMRGWSAQHVRLALLSSTEEGPSLRRVHRVRPLIYVTPAAPEAVPVPSGCWRVGAQPLPRLAVVFSVAGCAAQWVPAAIVAKSA